MLISLDTLINSDCNSLIVYCFCASIEFPVTATTSAGFNNDPVTPTFVYGCQGGLPIAPPVITSGSGIASSGGAVGICAWTSSSSAGGAVGFSSWGSCSTRSGKSGGGSSSSSSFSGGGSLPAG